MVYRNEFFILSEIRCNSSIRTVNYQYVCECLSAYKWAGVATSAQQRLEFCCGKRDMPMNNAVVCPQSRELLIKF